MPAPLGAKHWYAYHSDGGNTWNVFMRDVDAAATGFSAAAIGANPPIPARLKMRGVWAVTTGGRRRLFHVDANNVSYYTSGGNISADGDTWTITGRHGERTLGDGATS